MIQRVPLGKTEEREKIINEKRRVGERRRGEKRVGGDQLTVLLLISVS
jgi:hypothetical protein